MLFLFVPAVVIMKIWLFTGIAGAFSQNVVELAVGLACISSNTRPDTFKPCFVPVSAERTW
jgi:hypothetical protein